MDQFSRWFRDFGRRADYWRIAFSTWRRGDFNLAEALQGAQIPWRFFLQGFSTVQAENGHNWVFFGVAAPMKTTKNKSPKYDMSAD